MAGTVMAQRTTNMIGVDLDGFILMVMEDKKMNRRVGRHKDEDEERSQKISRGDLTARNYVDHMRIAMRDFSSAPGMGCQQPHWFWLPFCWLSFFFPLLFIV